MKETDFFLSEEHFAIRQAVAKFVEKELKPIVEEYEEKEEFPIEVHRKLGELGYLGIGFPERYGGSGGDLLGFAVMKEELCKVCPGFGVSSTGSVILFAHNVLEMGNEEQKEKYVPPVLRGEKIGAFALTEPTAGSDSLSIKTSSVRKGDYYVINGTKIFITNAPIADYFIVFTRTYGEGVKGGTAFIIERDMEGVQVGKPIKKLGMRTSPTGELILDNVHVHISQRLGEEGEGFIKMFSALDTERALAPITSLGIAQACLEASVKYASERQQFGRFIKDFQLIQEKIAEMASNIDLLRVYTYYVIKKKMEGHRITKEASIAKRFGAKVAVQSALDAIQIFGGYGYTREFGIEKFLRDAKLEDIGGGTTEIQTLVIAREIFKEFRI